MEFLFEILLELIAEGTVELSKSIKVPKYIRYPLIGIIALFFVAIIGIVIFAGLIALEENTFLGILFIIFGLFMLVMGVVKFKKAYLIRKNKE